MARKILGWGLLISWITASCYWHVCKIKGLCDYTLATQHTTLPDSSEIYTPPAFIVSDSTELSLTSAGNFYFSKSGASADHSTVQPILDSLAGYLHAHPEKRMIITGSYASSENNSTSFPDLGTARAGHVKELLTNQGLADSLFILKSIRNNRLVFYNDSLAGAIVFSFQTKPKKPETDLAGAQKFESIFKPMDLYFPAASAAYIKTVQNQQFLEEARKYLAIHKNKKLVLTGHTDDEDSAEWNLILSRKRAQAVKKQFAAATGLAPERMIVIAKGESQPKVSNDTPEGKRANRRVTIVVQ